MATNFKPAVGVEVFYDKYIGTITFVGEEYLTLCVRQRRADMVSDVCLIIHKEDWDSIELPKRSER